MKRILAVALLLSALLALVWVVGCATDGPQVQLVVLTDESGSMRPEAFGQQMEGLARALEAPDTLLHDGSVEFSHVRFGTSASFVEVSVYPTVITDEGVIAGIVNTVRSVEQEGRGTPIGQAIEMAVELVVGSEYFESATKQVLIIATDGRPDDGDRTMAARNEALRAGIDAIYVIPFGDANLEFLAQLTRLDYAFTPVHPSRSFEEAEEAFKGAIGGLVDRRLVPVADIQVDGALPSRDENTGLVHVTRQTGGSIDLSVPAFCPDGSQPDGVRVEVLRPSTSQIIAEADLRFLRPTWIGSVNVPSVATRESFDMYAVIDCRGTIFRQRLGTITLIDPSGYIYDTDDGGIVVGAIVELQQLVGGQWVTVNPFAWPIRPAVNPQLSDYDGHYGWDVPAGDYRVVVRHVDYYTKTSRQVTIPPEVTDLHVELEPINRAGYRAATIQLDWSQTPQDLDLHLYTPDGEHIYHAMRNGVRATLEADITSGFGPESIAVHEYVAGTYQILVHHFSGSGTLAESEARVKFTDKESGFVQEFALPLSNACGMEDTGDPASNAVWYVFSFTVNAYGELVDTETHGTCDAGIDY